MWKVEASGGWVSPGVRAHYMIQMDGRLRRVDSTDIAET
jgi:hypothetical protein